MKVRILILAIAALFTVIDAADWAADFPISRQPLSSLLSPGDGHSETILSVSKARPLAKMTSLESTQSIAQEQPSIRMEILMPEIVLAIPNQKLGRWTSKTIDTLISTNPPIPISLWKYASLLPELVTPEGQVLQPQAPLRRGEETPRCFVHGAGTMTFGIFTRLFRENNKLKLTFYEPFGDSGWYFDDLKPGTYQLRFTYQYCGKAVSC